MAEAPERKKTARQHIVLMIGELDPEGGVLTYTCIAAVTSLKAARKWIKDNGVAGERYQPACLIGLPCEVLVEPTEKRTLAPA